MAPDFEEWGRTNHRSFWVWYACSTYMTFAFPQRSELIMVTQQKRTEHMMWKLRGMAIVLASLITRPRGEPKQSQGIWTPAIKSTRTARWISMKTCSSHWAHKGYKAHRYILRAYFCSLDTGGQDTLSKCLVVAGRRRNREPVFTQ